MAHCGEKVDAEVPVLVASEPVITPAETTNAVVAATPAPSVSPLPADEMEQLGMTVVGFVQLIVAGDPIALPVGLLPTLGSDRLESGNGGFFTDPEGRCGILLNAGQGWKNALAGAVEDARRALGIDTN